jgi:hypothetical protein
MDVGSLRGRRVRDFLDVVSYIYAKAPRFSEEMAARLDVIATRVAA